MVSIRFGLQCFFKISAKYDIINDPEFKLSNEMFKVFLTYIKCSGKGSVMNEIINEEDILKLFSSHILDKNTAQGLQYKVFFDVMFYIYR